jgi:hypothetical protein
MHQRTRRCHLTSRTRDPSTIHTKQLWVLPKFALLAKVPHRIPVSNHKLPKIAIYHQNSHGTIYKPKDIRPNIVHSGIHNYVRLPNKLKGRRKGLCSYIGKFNIATNDIMVLQIVYHYLWSYNKDISIHRTVWNNPQIFYIKLTRLNYLLQAAMLHAIYLEEKVLPVDRKACWCMAHLQTSQDSKRWP